LYIARCTDYPNRLELRRDGIVHAARETEPAAKACISSPDVASNGARLTCGSSDFVYLVRGGKEEPVLVDNGIGDTSKEEATLSPGGRFVAYVDVGQTDPPGYSLSRLNLTTRYHRALATVHDPLPNLAWFEWQIDRIAWSPDGRWLAFSAHDEDGAREAIFRVNADGSGFRRLLANAGRPALSPDGKLLAFDSRRAGRRAVFVARVDGTNIQRISRGQLEAFAPRWRPIRRQGS
jgi:Tol biopolymer transport system component